MERKYYERCYIAFYQALDNIFEKSKKPLVPHPFSLCDLLSNMCPFTFATGMSADPAAYFDYERILKSKVGSAGCKTVANGYAAGQEFLKMYMAEYEYELEETLAKFSLDDYAVAYENIRLESV